MSQNQLPELDDDDEYLLDVVKGKRLRKKLSILNKQKVSREELDKLFVDEDDEM
jgi:hypothetical protein